MDPNIRESGRGPTSSPGASRFESQVDIPPPNPRLTSTWGHGIGTLHIPHSQNVNNPVVGGSNVNVYVNPAPSDAQTINPQHVDLDDIVTARADHEIYSSQLLTKKRGYPLWVPGPGMQLPIEYRRQGVSIGDVGIISSTGGFDFLFNIFLPADHPINDGMVPQEFSPLSRQGLERHIERTIVYGPNTHLAGASVRKISGHSISESSIDHRFESTAKEAAILVMPDGATTQNLLNTRGLRTYISSKVRGWYTYVTETCGREIKKGDIRVVVGIDKVSSWGIATSACNIGQTASYVFKHDPTYAYTWDCTGGSGRVGPPDAEIHDLIEGSAVLENQCVFVRTMNFTLSGDVRNDSLSNAVQQPLQGSGKSAHRGSAFGNRGGTRGRHSSSGKSSAASGHQSGSTQGSSHGVQLVNSDHVELGVKHPSAALHDRLHERFPDANVVITEDMDWISVLNDDDVVLPEPDDLCERILEAHDVVNNWGLIHLLKKADSKLQLSSGLIHGKVGAYKGEKNAADLFAAKEKSTLNAPGILAANDAAFNDRVIGYIRNMSVQGATPAYRRETEPTMPRSIGIPSQIQVVGGNKYSSPTSRLRLPLIDDGVKDEFSQLSSEMQEFVRNLDKDIATQQGRKERRRRTLARKPASAQGEQVDVPPRPDDAHSSLIEGQPKLQRSRSMYIKRPPFKLLALAPSSSIGPSQVPNPRRKTRTRDKGADQEDEDSLEGESVSLDDEKIPGIVKEASGSGNDIGMENVMYAGTSREGIDSISRTRRQEVEENWNRIRSGMTEKRNLGLEVFAMTSSARG